MGLFKRYFDMGVIYQRLHLLDADASRSMVRAGCRILKQKFSGNGIHSEGLGTRGIFCDVAKYSGFFFGRNERLVPLMLKKRWSAFGIFD
jgi:hypothetical protein